MAAQALVQASLDLPAEDLWERADFPAASSSPFLTTAACAEHCVTKLSNNTAGPARIAHMVVQREKAQKAASRRLLRFRVSLP